ncbi:MAG: hypothetical protein IJA34_01430, partial [Lachnospiraceae bacterium]|nr:hypothetical protein [Lachnospiraceae bacterium]
KKNDNDDNPIVITEPDIEKWGHVDNRVSENGAVNGDADTYTYTFTDLFIDDADYKVEIKCTDKVGNECEPPNYKGKATQDFTLDNTKPVVNVKYDNNNVQNSKYFNESREMTVTVTERNFDVENTKIFITKDGVESVIVPKVNEWTYVDNKVNGDADTYTYKYKFAESANYTVKIECMDLAGNKCALYNYEGEATQDFIIDKKAPNINDFKYENASKWVKAKKEGNHTMTVELADADFGINESTIKYYYSFAPETLKTPEKIEKIEKEGKTVITIPLVANDNPYGVYVTAEDKAGNPNTQNSGEIVCIDYTAPIVNVSYDNNTVDGYEKYFKANRTMTLTVIERNFDSASTKLIITKDGVERVISPSLNEWQHSNNKDLSNEAILNGDADTYTYQYTVAEDGDYTVRIECADLAGNECKQLNYEGNATQEFTIDKTIPTINVEEVSGYSSETINIALGINEHNFTQNDVKVYVSKKLNGQVLYTNQEYNAIWNDNGDTHNTVLTFAEDGDYTFTVTYVDMAGNGAVQYISQEFSVDNIDPILNSNISASNKNIANKGDIRFEYVYSDVNSENTNGLINYSVSTLSGKTIEWIPTIENVIIDGVNAYKITFNDLAENTSLKDGIYVLSVNVKDKAGRVANDTKQFSVNRRGSAYDYEKDSYVSKIISNGYTKSVSEDIVIQVMNCDDITEYQVIVFNSMNEQKLLKEGTDYKWELVDENIDIDSNVAEAGYKKYFCTIYKSVFEDNGTYSVRIMTKDSADDSLYGENATLISNIDAVDGNATDISFTVDNIKPEVILLGLKDGGNYDLATDMMIDYSDTNSIKSIIIRRLNSDGDVIETKEYTTEEIKAAGENAGRLIFNVKEYAGYQEVEVTVTDVAGNEQTKTIKVLITSNEWIKFINNTPLLVGSIAGIIIISIFIILLALKKKKKTNEN